VARTPLVVEDALRLRYKVFAEEMGANIASASGLDVDAFDEHCDHLVVRDEDTLRVVGTYRMLPPHRARDLGHLYADTEFDLHRFDHLRPTMVEIGRSCVHRDHRDGPTLMLLWAGLAQYMKAQRCRYAIGCASVSLADGGPQAAHVRDAVAGAMTPPEYRAFPRVPYPHAQIERGPCAGMPPLIKGYLRAGARIGGEPAWDPEFNSADFLTLLDLTRLNRRYARHFDLAIA
jgi:putative hemolysin